jgi:hypothetical protein
MEIFSECIRINARIKLNWGGNIKEFYKYPLFAGQYLNGCFNKLKARSLYT